MDVTVVIPTKNEEGNVEHLFRKLVALNLKMKIIFIDDASTDSTGIVEDKLKKKYSKIVDVVHRNESCGLGKALLNGYEHALMTRCKYVAQMDGDGQHDPEYLPKMLKEAMSGSGVVLGSRYIEQGSVGNWGLLRRLTSWGANLLVKRALKGSDVSDATTGYRVFRRDVLQKVFDSKPTSSGYVFQIEVLSKAIRSGAKITEVPIEFKPRISGRSKLNFRDKKEFFIFALKNIF